VSWDATPCHSDLWLEWLTPTQKRHALAITRFDLSDVSRMEIPERARFLLEVSFFLEYQAQAQFFSDWFMFIDEFGEFLFDSSRSGHDPARGQEFDFDEVNTKLFEDVMPYAAEILTVMNTRGTRIEPPINKLPAEVVKPNRAPHSVWHTIHLPRFQAPPLENTEISGPVLEKREHWVRAHRRDYRKGAGMFGRIKALVWVPEFQRGNPELGTVNQSFKVGPR